MPDVRSTHLRGGRPDRCHGTMPKLQYLGHRSEHFYLTPITPALTAAAVAAPAAKTTSSRLAFVIEYPRQMQSRIHVYEVLLAIAQIPSYIPGGARSFWKLIGLLLPVVGFVIALWLIWVVLRCVAKKLAAAFGRK